MEPIFFATPDEFRDWLQEHHDSASEVWVGFYKKNADTTGITYKEAVDEALCFGWIDGIRKGIDAQRFTNRFTPRKPRSIWSAVNIKRANELIESGRMAPPGLRAFTERDPARANLYSFEQTEHVLDPASEAEFRAHPAAWEFFAAQAPSYRRTAIWWVASARREETRRKRLATLIEDSAQHRRLAHLSRTPKA
jgi:uncharacterized protein YdeI (YjbR/CyaY-like superfamily)